MQEFRPPDVIAQDNELSEALAAGDLSALDSLVTRYGRAVRATVASIRTDDQAESETVLVFADAWKARPRLRDISPNVALAPWIHGLAAAGSGGNSTAQTSRAWDLALAIEAIDGQVRPVLNAHHVDGEELPVTADRHELRLRRRLSHIGDESEILSALADPLPWVDPPEDLVALVRSAVDQGESGTLGAVDRASVADVSDPDSLQQPGRVARSLRPVLLGLAGCVTVLFVAIIALSAASGSPDPIAFTADLTPTGAILDVEGGEISVTERDSGLRMDLDAPTLPRRAGDQYYEGVLVLQDGSELAVGTFNEGFDVTLSGGVSLDRVEKFLVVARALGSDVSDVVLKLDIPQS